MMPAATATRRDGSLGGPNVVALGVFLACFIPGILLTIAAGNPAPVIAAAVTGLVLMQSPRIAQQWERAVVLRLGRYHGLRGPGSSGSFPSSTA